MGNSDRKADWNDSPLVRRAARGEAEAWAKLVDRYSAYVYAILRSCRVPESDQADAFQYVFVELFKSIQSLTQTEYLGSWIRQTAVRHAIKVRQQVARNAGQPIIEVPSEADLESDLVAAERTLQIRAAIADLKEKCHALIQLLFLTDPPMRYEQAAAQLGVQTGSIAKLRERCLEALAKALEKRGFR